MILIARYLIRLSASAPCVVIRHQQMYILCTTMLYRNYCRMYTWKGNRIKLWYLSAEYHILILNFHLTSSILLSNLFLCVVCWFLKNLWLSTLPFSCFLRNYVHCHRCIFSILTEKNSYVSMRDVLFLLFIIFSFFISF